MNRPTYLTARRYEFASRAVALTIDGAAAGYFPDIDAALFSVSESAIHPAAWLADQQTSQNRDALYVTERIEFAAALADSRRPDPFRAAAEKFDAMRRQNGGR